MRDSSTEKIQARIDILGSNAVFIANDFIDIAEYETVRKTLNRMVDNESIQRVIRGVYYRPRYSEYLKKYEAPSPHEVAMAIARKFNWNIAPSGVTALNILGLSTQIPAKYCYISDGTYNSFDIGNIVIEFKRRNNREIAGKSYMTALVIQGIKALGKTNIDNTTINKIRNALTNEDRQRLLAESMPTTVWINKTIRQICGGN